MRVPAARRGAGGARSAGTNPRSDHQLCAPVCHSSWHRQPAALWKVQETHSINDLEHPLAIELGIGHLVAESGTRPTLLAKLVVGNKALGVVQVADRQDSTRFNDNDGRPLSILAAQAAAVIETARLYDELKRTKGLVGD